MWHHVLVDAVGFADSTGLETPEDNWDLAPLSLSCQSTVCSKERSQKGWKPDVVREVRVALHRLPGAWCWVWDPDPTSTARMELVSSNGSEHQANSNNRLQHQAAIPGGLLG